MARIAGINLPPSKCVVYGLRYITGIGLTTSKKICKMINLDERKRVKDLTDQEVADIRRCIEEQEILVEGDLKREVAQNVKRLIDLRCYRGIRHSHNLPCRGQRTKSNARTRRGKRKAVAGKKS